MAKEKKKKKRKGATFLTRYSKTSASDFLVGFFGFYVAQIVQRDIACLVKSYKVEICTFTRSKMQHLCCVNIQEEQSHRNICRLSREVCTLLAGYIVARLTAERMS